jgi:hypothetical protein
MLPFLINFIVLHLAIACYNLLYYYNLLDNKTNYSNNYIVYNNYNQIKFLIKTNIKLVLHKELLFRIYLVEIMKLFLNEEELIFLWVLTFASFNIYYHNYEDNLIKLSRFVYMIIVSYYLINNSILASIVIHIYTELLGIFIQHKLFKYYTKVNIFYKNKQVPEINNATLTNDNSVSNKLKQIMGDNIELASKEEVEQLLSTKKIN